MNNTITKADLIKIIASQSSIPASVLEKQFQGLIKLIAEEAVETFLKTIAHSLASGRRVELRGFGVWETRIGKARVGRNPNHPEKGQITIPARPVIRFKASKELREAVQALCEEAFGLEEAFQGKNPTPPK